MYYSRLSFTQSATIVLIEVDVLLEILIVRCIVLAYAYLLASRQQRLEKELLCRQR